jgi:hypothetical protein
VLQDMRQDGHPFSVHAAAALLPRRSPCAVCGLFTGGPAPEPA